MLYENDKKKWLVLFDLFENKTLYHEQIIDHDLTVKICRGNFLFRVLQTLTFIGCCSLVEKLLVTSTSYPIDDVRSVEFLCSVVGIIFCQKSASVKMVPEFDCDFFTIRSSESNVGEPERFLLMPAVESVNAIAN